MANRKRGKINTWTIVIVLLVSLLAIRIIIIARSQKKGELSLKEVGKPEKPPLKFKTVLPQIEDIQERGHLAAEAITEKAVAEKEELSEEVKLKELPLGKFSPQKPAAQEGSLAEGALKIRPSSEEINKLKRKGLIIY